MARKKLFYKIGEACKVLDIQPYVLRYWETEFPILSPGKSKSGQRVYSEKDLAITRRIKTLLYEEGYTIAGAKKRLESELEANGGEPPAEDSVQRSKPEFNADVSGKKATAPKPKQAPAEIGENALELEKMRQAVAAALTEARDILALLEDSSH